MDNFLNNMDKKVLKYLSSFLLILSIFFVVKILSGLKEYRIIGKGVYPSSVITVNGKGEIFAKPDVASFTFSIQESGKTAMEAQDKATKKNNEVIDSLKGMIEEKDIKTISYNLYPKYEYQNVACTQYYCPPSKSIIAGYEVSQTISVKVRKIDKSGDVLAKIGGLNVSNISGISFVVDNIDDIKKQARDEAIKDAKKQAQILAKNLGVRLKKITSFYENQEYGGYPYAEGMGGGAMVDTAYKERVAPNIPAGENRITSNISISYEIED